MNHMQRWLLHLKWELLWNWEMANVVFNSADTVRLTRLAGEEWVPEKWGRGSSEIKRWKIHTGQLCLDVLQVCRAGAADGDGGGCHALTVVHIQEVSWDRQLLKTNHNELNQDPPTALSGQRPPHCHMVHRMDNLHSVQITTNMSLHIWGVASLTMAKRLSVHAYL